MGMKFEKISENKIKCILNRQDLAERHFDVRELTSGSDSAHKLLAELMNEARKTVGFNVRTGAPLMVEALATSEGEVAIIITNVEGQDDALAEAISITSMGEPLEGIEEPLDPEEIREAIGNFFDFAKKQIMNGKKNAKDNAPLPEKKPPLPIIIVRTYVFQSKKELLSATKALKRVYDGHTEIYLHPKTNNYYLVLHKDLYDVEVFNKICNIMTEFGAQVRVDCANESYYREHYELLFDDVASKITNSSLQSKA